MQLDGNMQATRAIGASEVLPEFYSGSETGRIRDVNCQFDIKFGGLTLRAHVWQLLLEQRIFSTTVN